MRDCAAERRRQGMWREAVEESEAVLMGGAQYRPLNTFTAAHFLRQRRVHEVGLKIEEDKRIKLSENGALQRIIYYMISFGNILEMMQLWRWRAN